VVRLDGPLWGVLGGFTTTHRSSVNQLRTHVVARDGNRISLPRGVRLLYKVKPKLGVEATVGHVSPWRLTVWGSQLSHSRRRSTAKGWTRCRERPIGEELGMKLDAVGSYPGRRHRRRLSVRLALTTRSSGKDATSMGHAPVTPGSLARQSVKCQGLFDDG
jgi:hypothetical protein